ncbi:MAG: DUF4416 family protein [Candidatus Omnitrophica bacterium]|nr:DUF4416 family protein [Candidatus Omnitrophota bacterium]
MGTPAKPARLKLFCGIIFKDHHAAARAEAMLCRRFGETDFQSQSFDFNQTTYYRQELGDGLKKRFVAFKKLILPDELPSIKLLTNRMEEKLSLANRRLVNLDPGYLDLAKVVLASTKDYVHRVYLKKGIYAEMTLCYRGKSFQPWEWTYPDYRTQGYIAAFNQLRDLYARQIKENRP